jgi:hypothetical protein
VSYASRLLRLTYACNTAVAVADEDKNENVGHALQTSICQKRLKGYLVHIATTWRKWGYGLADLYAASLESQREVGRSTLDPKTAPGVASTDAAVSNHKVSVGTGALVRPCRLRNDITIYYGPR